MKKFNWEKWPKYNQNHARAVNEVIVSNQLFAAEKVRKFEEAYSNYIGSKYALGLGNATQGLQLSLHALGIGYGDEVIVTPYSWISSASCVLMQGAIPIFVDIEPESFGISPELLERAITKKTKAVILVHMFGYPAKVKEISEICKKYSINLIEDASHAHGGKFKNQNLGTFGDISVFSLHQRKALPLGDGGIICTNKKKIFEDIYQMRSFGHKKLSYNYRMTEFAGALGLECLKNLDKENLIRRENHNFLAENLNNSIFRVIEPIKDSYAVYYSNLIEIDLPLKKQKDLLSYANSANLLLKRTWQPLNKNPSFMRENMNNNFAPWDNHYENFEEPNTLNLPISEEYQEKRLFELDCHPLITKKEIKQAAEFLKSF